jgi:DNA-binding response OmpR family regulator
MKEKGKILVIEDNIRWQEKLRKYLTAAGYYVEVAETIEMALQKVVCDRFHFITIDMQLDNNNQSPLKYEGWKILEVVTKLRIQYTTPCMKASFLWKNLSLIKKSSY